MKQRNTKLLAAILLAIRRQASRVKSRRSRWTPDQHADAIIALSKEGLKAL